MLLASGCEQGSSSPTSIALPSTVVDVTTITVPIDAAVVASVDAGTLRIDFTGHPVDRSMGYTVSKGDEGILVGYLATEGGPGAFVAYEADRPLEFPDGLVTGHGPDVFDVSGLPSGTYTACAVAMPAEQQGLVCVGFTIEPGDAGTP